MLTETRRLGAADTHDRILLYNAAWAMSVAVGRAIAPCYGPLLQIKGLNKRCVVCTGPVEGFTKLEVGRE